MSLSNKFEPLIRLEKVSLKLGNSLNQVEILRSINLDIAEKEKISIVGSSGSGKTSLLLVIAGLEKATEGSISVDGQNLTALSEDALASFRQKTVGIVFQSFHLIPTMTALENVAIPLELAGAADVKARAEFELLQVGLENRLSHYPSELSGGEQQRVAIARALVANPKLILADEPTGNLDSATGSQIIEILFAQANKSKTTLIYVTHDDALAQRADRSIKLRDGKLEID